MASAAESGLHAAIVMRVTVAYAAPGAAMLVTLDLPSGATVAQAADRSGLVAKLGLDAGTLRFAIFGQAARPDTPLRDGDRVELTRPLLVDPKVARRRRASAASGQRGGRSPRRSEGG